MPVMIPSDLRLLQSVRKIVNHLEQQSLPGSVTSHLKAIDVVLNELMLRHDTDFLREHCEQGRTLMRKGLSLRIGGEQACRRLKPVLEGIPFMRTTDESREVLEAAISSVTSLLDKMVALAAGRSDVQTRAFVDRVTDWEVCLYAHRMQTASTYVSQSDDPMSRLTPEAFQAYLRTKFPDAAELEIKRFECAPPASTKATFLIELSAPVNGASALVLRVEPVVEFMHLDGSDIADEFQVLNLAHEAGLLLPEPLWFEEDISHFGLRFIVSRGLPGSTLGDARITQAALSERSVRELAANLARIHAVPLTQHRERIERCHLHRWSEFPSVEAATRAAVDYWYVQADKSGIGASPLITRCLSWLAQNVAATKEKPVLLHGNMGLHTMLVHDGGIPAILDWEASRIGDPAEDLSSLFTNTPGTIDRARFLQLYREAGGASVSEYRLRYFDVYHAVRTCITALASLQRVEDCPSANIGFAVFGLQHVHDTASKLNELIVLAERTWNEENVSVCQSQQD
jgi:aminoglycoside phosphotransferase (APT) family kinase protein